MTNETKARSKFSKYKKQEPKAVRDFKVNKDPKIESLRRLCGDLLSDPSRQAEIKKEIQATGHMFTAEDVEKFSLILREFEDSSAFELWAGPFLNVVMQASRDNDFILRLHNISSPIHDLGAENDKNLTIHGGKHEFLGNRKEQGIIRVHDAMATFLGIGLNGAEIHFHGDVHDPVGPGMEEGLIVVYGNVIPNDYYTPEGIADNPFETVTGQDMVNGLIEIRGNAAASIGHGMMGGEIHLEGDYVSIGDVGKGTIYHKGKIILSK